MKTLIISTNSKIADNIKEKLFLSNTEGNELGNEFEVFKNKKNVLICSPNSDNSIKKSILFGYSEYSPEIIIFLSQGISISNDIMDGDIILPNVFFDFDENIHETDFDNNNKDSFLGNPIFLENYNLQKDYDFKDFGLVVGGISVSGDILNKLPDIKEKLRIAYEADVYDENSYIFMQEIKQMSLLDKTYMIIGINNLGNNTYLNHLASIMNFLLENKTDELIVEEDDE